MKKDVVIIGGGVAGLWCAWELAALGLDSAIVESAPSLGGHTAKLCCKATDRCRRCGACLLEDVLRNVNKSAAITSFISTTVRDVRRQNGHFAVTLSKASDQCAAQKVTIDEADRIGREPITGTEAGAIDKESPGGAGVPAGHEATFQCQLHEDVMASDGPLQVEASAVVVASGFKAFDPSEKPRFGHGRVPGVMTGLELESMIRDDNWIQPDPAKVAFIQCVGSRDPKIGRNYCSRVCCGYALRLARLLRSHVPELETSMFYMDMQSFDRDFEGRLAEAAKEVNLIRSIPSEVRAAADGRPEVIYYGPDENRVIEAYDLVVLSVGISPSDSTGALAKLLDLELNADGFLGGNGEEVSTNRNGVFVAGTAQGPRSIEDTVSHAIRTAGEVASYVRTVATGGST